MIADLARVPEEEGTPEGGIPKCFAGECERRGSVRGLCFSHYQNARRLIGAHDDCDSDDCEHVREGLIFGLLHLREDLLAATGGDCLNLPGPCTHGICRYNLTGEGQARARSRRDVTEPCALRLAEEGGGMTLDEIGNKLGCTRERVRQVEADGLKHLRRRLAILGIHGNDVRDVLASLGRREL